jgi:F-type H+-transporting ATPase subunit gamma
MANMREIKIRIKSIKETRQITKAMKLISAAKLKKARQQLELTLPYFNRVRTTIADILKHSGNIDSRYFDLRHQKPVRKKGYIIITGDKGLAGGYNHNVIKLAEDTIGSDKQALLMVAGFIGRNYFIRENYNVMQDFQYGVQNPTVFRAREIAETALQMFSQGEVDEVDLIFTEMVSAIKLDPVVMKLLPLDLESLVEDVREFDTALDENMLYEPSPKAVFDVLIPKYVKGIIYGALVESFTSEQSARMTAMDSATANADEMIQKLDLFYNRARQAAITQEISEIVGGAAAINK